MNENNRPKRPEEILAALSAEGNRIEQLTKEIDEKIYAFYGIQKQFIENGNLITAEHKKVLADLKNYKLPEISLDASSKKQFEEVKQYEKNVRKKDRTIPYLIFIIFLLVVTFVYFFNQDLRVKKEVKENLINEIYSKGDTIVSKKDFDLSIRNINIMNEWIDENPIDSKKLVKFLNEKNKK
ncbi:hypothetical protein HX001_17675 [Empedobacter brevis]|uniref:Anti-sigma factor n=2 Tax=Empedobacter TaxID=59734 RepID=A0AAW7DMS6_9FLAO|nr:MULTISPECIES: hypothetical protein [Empedobacter]MDM1074317.1 hypothetical protein [Empedobacter brevis]MDM1549494.1 hypothetical protein [Empedobacter falsenii]MDM1552875.1 hypothetical protein [Empedobacter falsenii]